MYNMIINEKCDINVSMNYATWDNVHGDNESSTWRSHHTVSQKCSKKTTWRLKLWQSLYNSLFFARDINHKTCTMHSHTCTNIHALSVLKLTGVLHPVRPAMALHSALTLSHIVCASHKCEGKTRRWIHSTFKMLFHWKEKWLCAIRTENMWPSLQKAKSHTTWTASITALWDKWHECQQVKDGTKETILKYDWL